MLIRTKIVLGIVATFALGVGTAVSVITVSWQHSLAAIGAQSLAQARSGFTNLELNDTRMLSCGGD